MLLPNFGLFQYLLTRHEDLGGIHRFNKELSHFFENGFIHEIFFFTLGNQNYRKSRFNLFDLTEGGHAVFPGHKLIQENQIIGILSNHGNSVLAVGGFGHSIPFFFQEKNMGFQVVNFVVDPEYFSTISSHKRLEKYRLLMIV